MEEKKLSRRSFLKLATIASTGVVLGACQPSAPTAAPAAAKPAEQKPAEPTKAPAPAAPITVRLWVAWGNMNKLFQDEVWYKMPEYNEICPNIKIEYKGNTGDAPVQTAIAGGDPPEAASNISYAQLAIKDVFLDCEPLVAASKYVKEADFIPAVWNFCKFWTFKGLLGVPAFESFLDYGLNYNQDMVKKAGLDPEKPPATFGEALEWHKALTIKDSAGNLKQFGLDPYDAMGGDPDGMEVACNHPYWDDKTGKFDFTNDLFVQYFDITRKFYDVMGPDQIAGLRQAEGMGGWGGSYNAEVQAMITEGYWHPGETTVQAPEVAKKNRASWALVIDPLKGKKIQVAGGHTFAIFKKSKYPQEAFKLAEFFLTDAALDVLFKQVGWIVGKKSYVAKIDPKSYPGLEFYFKSANEATEWYELRRCPLHGYIWGQIGEVREMMYRGKITPKQAAEEMQKRSVTEWQNQGLPT
jgi:maltose-binding protein MalE